MAGADRWGAVVAARYFSTVQHRRDLFRLRSCWGRPFGLLPRLPSARGALLPAREGAGGPRVRSDDELVPPIPPHGRDSPGPGAWMGAGGRSWPWGGLIAGGPTGRIGETSSPASGAAGLARSAPGHRLRPGGRFFPARVGAGGPGGEPSAGLTSPRHRRPCGSFRDRIQDRRAHPADR